MSRTIGILALSALGLGLLVRPGGADLELEFQDHRVLGVSALANIFGAGHARPPDPQNLGAGILPVEIPLVPGRDNVVVFPSVTGRVDPDVNSPLTKSNGPDGGDGFEGLTNTVSLDGISGIVSAGGNFFLTGVFLDDTEPVAPAPARLDFTANTDFLELSPALRQTFFVGDGRTGRSSGAVQRLNVPEGATRLFLGFADAFGFVGTPGAFDDNGGKLDVSVQVLTGGEDLEFFDVTRLKVGLKFNALAKDSVTLKARLPLPLGFDPTGQVLDLDVGGVKTSFTLDRRGRATNALGKARLSFKKKTGTWHLFVKQKGGEFAEALSDDGLVNGNAKKKTVKVRTLVCVEGTTFLAVSEHLYTAKARRKGKLK